MLIGEGGIDSIVAHGLFLHKKRLGDDVTRRPLVLFIFSVVLCDNGFVLFSVELQ